MMIIEKSVICNYQTDPLVFTFQLRFLVRPRGVISVVCGRAVPAAFYGHSIQDVDEHHQDVADLTELSVVLTDAIEKDGEESHLVLQMVEPRHFFVKLLGFPQKVLLQIVSVFELDGVLDPRLV